MLFIELKKTALNVIQEGEVKPGLANCASRSSGPVRFVAA